MFFSKRFRRIGFAIMKPRPSGWKFLFEMTPFRFCTICLASSFLFRSVIRLRNGFSILNRFNGLIKKTVFVEAVKFLLQVKKSRALLLCDARCSLHEEEITGEDCFW